MTRALLIGTLLTASFGLAAAPGGGCKEGWKGRDHQGEKVGVQGRNWDKMAERLSITEEQQAVMRGIREEARPRFSELREKMKENRKQLRALNRQEGHDAAKLAELAQAQGKLKADMIILRSEVKAKIGAVLTDEQRERMKAMRAARGERK